MAEEADKRRSCGEGWGQPRLTGVGTGVRTGVGAGFRGGTLFRLSVGMLWGRGRYVVRVSVTLGRVFVCVAVGVVALRVDNGLGAVVLAVGCVFIEPGIEDL